uniref:Polyphenol oxidase n=1 Tax=Clematis terniflora TaxID=231663 RepID=A0A4P8L6C8_CLETE|nr:polyphenol oxidase [Clematis terniflora]
MAFLTPRNNTITTTENIRPSLPASLLSVNKAKICRFNSQSSRITRGVTCNASNEEKRASQDSLGKIDRRNVLLGIGGLYGLNSLSASAAPIAPPDLSKCGPPDLPPGVEPTNCCPPSAPKIVDFKLPSYSTPLRVRPAAHLVDDEYIAKYSKAVALMKALPDDDPRNFMQQANVHCAYCDGAYDQVGFPDLELQTHFSWTFFPFHRLYVYFHEKILGSLIGDPTFALPFWNYDTPGGMRMPTMYANTNSPLYDRFRDALHQPPTMIDLDYNFTDRQIPEEEQININLSIMYRQMVSNGKNTRLFLGEPYRRGDQPAPGQGSLENIPHSQVHAWTGDRAQPNNEDMANFYSAARDPIFFAHHGNVDRMWTIWKTLGGKRKDYTDPDWLDTAFLFYDENKQLVRVRVRDSLDPIKLRYRFQDVEIPWLRTRPTPQAQTTSTSKTKKASTRSLVGTTQTAFPRALDAPVTVLVSRPKKKRSKKEKEDEEEVLLIEGIEVDKDKFAKFDIYVNDEDDKKPSAASTEFAGSFVNIPHRAGNKSSKLKTHFRVSITDLLEDLDADDDDEVLVTLVPRQGNVTIARIKIVLAS